MYLISTAIGSPSINKDEGLWPPDNTFPTNIIIVNKPSSKTDKYYSTLCLLFQHLQRGERTTSKSNLNFNESKVILRPQVAFRTENYTRVHFFSTIERNIGCQFTSTFLIIILIDCNSAQSCCRSNSHWRNISKAKTILPIHFLSIMKNVNWQRN
jgi:hypothetical protein